jgi:DNA-binding MarR family transcriptional regulator
MPRIDRAQVRAELMDELFVNNPAKALHYMRRWPGGALSLVHLNVISILDADGPLPMSQLAEALDVSQASTTGIVDRMEQRGLIERQRDDDDRRVTRVALTERGRVVIERLGAERREKLGRLLEELTDDELEAFLVGTRAMRRARERHFGEVTEPEGKSK